MKSWGNLLSLGTIHLSPRGSLVDEFILYLGDVHNIQNISSSNALDSQQNATFASFLVHDTANSSIEYILNNLNERTFVSINLDTDDNDVSFMLRILVELT